METRQSSSAEQSLDAIPPVFQDPHQRMLYNFFPPPPITFPVTDGEIEQFPRRWSMKTVDGLKHRFRKRRSLYRQMSQEVASNARRPDRGKHIFVIRPETMDRILEAVESIHAPSSLDVQHALWSMYYQGKTLDEIELMISEKTIKRLLMRAERIVGVIPDDAPEGLAIGIPTIKLSYQILRFGRDAIFDIQRYFRGRVY